MKYIIAIVSMLLIATSIYAQQNNFRVDQGWSQADRDQIYTLTEGSELMPIKWLLNLERSRDSKKISNVLEDYGFVFESKTDAKLNPYKLPIGLTTHRNVVTGKLYGDSQWVGVNCTACHTAQVDLNGKKLIIDGGPSLFRIQNFENDIISAVRATIQDKRKLDQFLIATQTPTSKSTQVIQYLKLFESEFSGWVTRSHRYLSKNGVEIKNGPGRVDGLGGPTNDLTCMLTPRMGETALEPQFVDKRNCENAHPAVSLPHLWGMGDSEWVQWDGGVHFSLARNFGQSTGTYGKNWVQKNALGIPVLKSSARVGELLKIEEIYKKLKSPDWDKLSEAGLVEKLKLDRVSRGHNLYNQNCITCHALQPATSMPNIYLNRYWKTPIYAPVEIGVDASYTSRNLNRRSFVPREMQQNYSFLFSAELFDKNQRMLAAKFRATNIATMSFTAYSELKSLNLSFNVFLDLFNPIGAHTVRTLIHDVAEFTNCRNPLNTQKKVGLKARSLEGIGFTAPYLHNGSVPTLYDLLKPVAQRPQQFWLGCRRYDTNKLGYSCSENDLGVERFNTQLETNSNQGHEYATHLSDNERLDLIEFIKSIKNPKRPFRLHGCY